jgi:hypothetical protein
MATLVKQLTKKKRTEPFTGPQETVEEFLARGGEITVIPPNRAPGEMASDAPRRPLSAIKGNYNV